MSRKKKILLSVLALIIYVLVLGFIAFFERMDSAASIKSLGDSFWYSIATLTTVGYGDYYPVTLPGRLLGLLLMILSVGFFGFLVSVFVTNFSKIIIPYAILSNATKNKWYIFSEISEHSLCLSRSILEEDDNAFVIFIGKKNKDAIDYSFGSRVIFVQMSINEIFKKKKNGTEVCLFFVGENGYVNYQKALEYNYLDVDIYCETSMYIDDNPANIHLFNEYYSLARFLWITSPLAFKEKKIVIAGCGKYGNEIIEQALLVNVDGTLGEREYHIFGEINEFCHMHTELAVCFGINEKVPGKDVIYFHKEPLFDNLNYIKGADRIILCFDQDEDNLKAYSMINKYIPYTSQVYIREGLGIKIMDNKAKTFGSLREIFSYSMIIKDELTKKAMSMHNTYCEKNPENAVAWEKLSEFTRRSNYSVADHIATKIRILLGDDIDINEDNMNKARDKYNVVKEKEFDLFRRIEHERWMRFHIINNWKYAEKRCNEKRFHNLIVPYDELSLEQQEKDDCGWEIL